MIKFKFLALTALITAFTCNSYAQVTIGRPVARSFSGKVLGDKPNANKPNPGNANKPNSGNANNTNSGNANNTASSGSFSNAQIEKANTAKDATYLTQAEKDVILYCNLARLDGQTFANQYLGKLKGSSNSYEQSLLKDLAGIKNLPMLKPNSRLAKAAKVHVEDIGPKGLVQHESSDGTATFTRVRKYYNGGYMGENISCGYSAAMDIVLQLLVDDGVESLGHRHNILNKSFVRIGVAIGSHSQYRNCCVQDFSDDRDDNAEETGNNNNSNNNVTNNNNSNNNNVVNNGGNRPDHGGYHPNNGGNRPDHGGNRPNNGGNRPDHGGNRPDHGGYHPGNNHHGWDYDDDDDEDYGDYDDCGDYDDDSYYNAEDDEYYNDEGDYYDDDNYFEDDYYDDDYYDDDEDAYYDDYDY